MNVITVGEHRDRGVWVPQKRNLIEVSLPLGAIKSEAAGKKSIRLGHPSCLHLRGAHRPLAVARTMAQRKRGLDASTGPEQEAEGRVADPTPAAAAPPTDGAKTKPRQSRSAQGPMRYRHIRSYATAEMVRQAVDGVIRHFVAADGSGSVEIVLEMCGDSFFWFSKSLSGPDNENSQVPGFRREGLGAH